MMNVYSFKQRWGLNSNFGTFIQIFCLGFGLMGIARLGMLDLLGEKIFTNPWSDIFYALYIGFKFDLRWAVFLSLPIFLALLLTEAWLCKFRFWRWVATGLTGMIFFVITLSYCVDVGFFFYLHQRLDATLVDFLDNPAISWQMVNQSYPVVLITLGIVVFVAAYVFVVYRILSKHQLSLPRSKKSRFAWGFVACVLLFLMGYGQISSNLFPLRWSNAYFSADKDLAILALHPLQNIIDTNRAAAGTRPDLVKVGEAYAHVAAWLGVDAATMQHSLASKQWNFVRKVPAKTEVKRNVVLIIMESLTWPRTSLAPNLTSLAANPTPVLLDLAKDSLVFDHFYAPARTTARAIFTTMTGIPDVNRTGGTSSRNQSLVDQALIMNEFKGYAKYYFLGGSASWANIRGILKHNIAGLNLIEEGSWKAPNTDVWGISDFALFKESAGFLSASKEPFVAVIHTAGFHRPYTIPGDRGDFRITEPSAEVLLNYGYADAEEYNSARFSDYALGEFFRLAKQQSWFKDTIFAITGDHGLNDPSLNVSPGYLACSLQSNQVPLLLYAPGLIAPGLDSRWSGHPDVFTTLARLAGVEHRNNTLGRDLLDPNLAASAKQFVAGNAESFVRLLQGNYCYIKEQQEALYDLSSGQLENLLQQEPEVAAYMRQAAQDFYQVSKFLLYNNQKDKVQSK